jgi:hypothetical protein
LAILLRLFCLLTNTFTLICFPIKETRDLRLYHIKRNVPKIWNDVQSKKRVACNKWGIYYLMTITTVGTSTGGRLVSRRYYPPRSHCSGFGLVYFIVFISYTAVQHGFHIKYVVTWWVPLVEKELIIPPEDLSPSSVYFCSLCCLICCFLCSVCRPLPFASTCVHSRFICMI